MVVVSIYAALSLAAAAPFGFALSRYLLGRMPDQQPRPTTVPEEYARYRRHDLVPAVVIAESLVRQEHQVVADLYDTPTTPEPAHQ